MPNIGDIGYYSGGWNGNSNLTFDGTSNLSVGGVEYSTVPRGAIMMMSISTVPDGWLECNGQSTTSYAELNSLIGANVPDLRGEFIRGWDHGRGIDSGRTIGSTQSQATALPSNDFTGTTSTTGAHTHTYTTYANDNWGSGSNSNWPKILQTSGTVSGSLTTNSDGSHSHTVTIDGGGDSETRPRNVALMFIIKY